MNAPQQQTWRGIMTRAPRLLAVLGAVCLLGLSAARLAGAETAGAISGHITSSFTHAAIQGITVCAASTVVEVKSEEEGEGPANSGCATTDASGGYTITGLAAGSYYVEFRAAARTLNYVAQFYPEKASAAEAQPVAVAAPGTTAGIDAQLQPGGQITGTVTVAATHAPLSLVAACATPLGSPAETEDICGITASNGTYTIQNLPGGSFTVAFIDLRHKYAVQFYKLKATLAEAEPVTVSPPATTPGIDAALEHTPPRTPGAGTPPPGPIPPSASGQPQTPLALAFAIQLHSTKITVRGRDALVGLSCHANTTCRGTLTLTGTLTTTHGGKKLRRTVTIANASFTIAPRHTTTIAVPLNPTGRNLLKTAHGTLNVRLTISQHSPAPPRTLLHAVRLLQQKAPAPKKH